MSSPANAGSPAEGTRDSSPSSAGTPRRKEKKRVGFHQGHGDRPTSMAIDNALLVSSSQQQRQKQQQPQQSAQQLPVLVLPSSSPLQPHHDSDENTDPFATPSATPKREPTRTGAPDAAELRRALSRILTTPEGTAVSPPNGPAEGQASQPRRPRPVLKRNTGYDAPEEREKADIAELNTSEREHLSGLAARQRAHNLAVRVENYSSPHHSRRASSDATALRLSFDSDEERDLEAGDGAVSTGFLMDDGMADRTPGRRPDGANGSSANLRSRPRKNSHLTAENLVRTHTRRVKLGVSQPDYFTYQPPSGARSGAVTPTIEQSYAHNYVPPPKKYHGGILGSLLQLYNEGGNSGGSSSHNTPIATPNISPPSSVPPSTPGSPRPSRPSSGFFGELSAEPEHSRTPSGGTSGLSLNLGQHRHHHNPASQSSLALTELMKSTSTLIAPGSSIYSGGVNDKIKHDAATTTKKRRPGIFGGGGSIDGSPKIKPKSKAKAKVKAKEEKIRITIHIAQILSRHKYLVQLCRALMMYGAPTHRLEEYMTMSARVLEIEGQFLYFPGSMLISFDDSATHTTEVKIVRAPQGVNLGKLHDVHHIYKQVIHDHISVDEASATLDGVMQRDLKFGRWQLVPVYGLASACVAPFAFEGRFIDLPVAFVLGCLLGWLQLIVAPSNELYANVFEISASIATSFLARAFGSIADPRFSDLDDKLFCFSALAQSSIALILPGYIVLCSALELQSRHLVAGSVRMVYAMIYTLFLGYGTTIGVALYGMIDRRGASSATHCVDPLHRNWHLLFVPLFTMSLCVINQAKWKQTPVMLIISLAGFLANSYSSTYFKSSTQISNMLGALTVGILANTYARAGRHVEGAWLAFLDWWDLRVHPRFFFSSVSRRRNEHRRSHRRTFHHHNHPYSHHPLRQDDIQSEIHPMHRTTAACIAPGASGHASSSSSLPATPSVTTEKHSSRANQHDHSPSRENEDQTIPQKRAADRDHRRKKACYGLAAAAMLPAIFVQVPSGIAANGSLLAGVTTANQITNTTVNGTSMASSAAAAAAATATSSTLGLENTGFAVMFSVIQVAVGITVGLFLSALIVYPFGKRRSGLLSF